MLPIMRRVLGARTHSLAIEMKNSAKNKWDAMRRSTPHKAHKCKRRWIDFCCVLWAIVHFFSSARAHPQRDRVHHGAHSTLGSQSNASITFDVFICFMKLKDANMQNASRENAVTHEQLSNKPDLTRQMRGECGGGGWWQREISIIKLKMEYLRPIVQLNCSPFCNLVTR